jgi:hypothetical protein
MNLIIAKAEEAPVLYHRAGKVNALLWAANLLWQAEYHTWRTLADLFGCDCSSAKCAWERRTAYAEAYSVLMHAL